MRSNVKSALLSLVIESPSGGADVCRRFEARFEGLLESRRNHIYDALARLVDEGMIERISLAVPEIEREDEELGRGSAFRATAKGARAYRSWMFQAIPYSKDARQEALVRFAATQAHDVETALRLLEDYEGVVLELAKRAVPGARALMDELLAEERQDFAQAELRWIRRSRARLRTEPRRR